MLLCTLCSVSQRVCIHTLATLPLGLGVLLISLHEIGIKKHAEVSLFCTLHMQLFLFIETFKINSSFDINLAWIRLTD